MDDKLTATAGMAKVGLSWPGIADAVNHVLNLLQTQGQAAVGLCRHLLKLVAAVTDRDMTQVFILANQEYVDVQALAAAIRAEFGV